MNEFKLEEHIPKAKRNKLFSPPNKSMLCRQALWKRCRETDPNPVILVDFYKYQGDFGPGIVYRAAKTLVVHGILERKDISWTTIIKGKKRTACRCAIKFVQPFATASRKW